VEKSLAMRVASVEFEAGPTWPSLKGIGGARLAESRNRSDVNLHKRTQSTADLAASFRPASFVKGFELEKSLAMRVASVEFEAGPTWPSLKGIGGARPESARGAFRNGDARGG
jgi:hypothetical protein